MMKTKRLAIQNPCSESWADMTPQEQGRHCAKCDKVVVDLTEMGVREAFQRVTESETKMCVRVLPQHLNYEHRAFEPHQNGISLKAVAMGAALISLAGLNSCAHHERPLKGKIAVVESNSVQGEIAVADTVQRRTGVAENAAKQYIFEVRGLTGDDLMSETVALLIHGEKTDTLQVADGRCKFFTAAKTFTVRISNPYYQPTELTESDFKKGRAIAELTDYPLMGDVIIEEQ